MCKTPYFSIGFTIYGCMEARYVLGGNLVAVGVSYTAVPGQSLKAKRQALFEMSADDLGDLVKAHGWHLEANAGNCILTPTGCLIMYLCPAQATWGVRWAVASDQADELRVVSQLSTLLDEYPEMKGPTLGYSQVLEHLRSSGPASTS